MVADELVHGHPRARAGRPQHGDRRDQLARAVDPPGQSRRALLQRTGLNLDAGQVVFGFGGNNGDCASTGVGSWRSARPAARRRYFTVDAAAGEREGAIWMGGAAPAVDAEGTSGWASATAR